MALEHVPSPFSQEPVTEVPLQRTPLVAVLFQVRFPMAVSRVQSALASGDLQAALSDDFPFAGQQDSFNFLIQPGQAAIPQQGPPTWVLKDESSAWTCNIAPDSVALTTTSYTSRSDFTSRAERLLAAVEKVASPPRVSRVGVRYLNSVPDPAVDDWVQTLAQGARGILVALDAADRTNIVNSFSQTVYKWPDGSHQLQGRWGVLPPNAVIDAAMPPVATQSWVLDIDSFIEADAPFDAVTLAQQIGDAATRAYRFFRWVVTPESLKRFEPMEQS